MGGGGFEPEVIFVPSRHLQHPETFLIIMPGGCYYLEGTPVFLPGESQGQRSLVGCRLWSRTESDMTEAT